MASGSSRSDSVAALHRYLRNDGGEPHDRIREIVFASPDILWEPNAIGWTAMHVVASLGSVTHESWLLNMAAAAIRDGETLDKSSFVSKRTHNGGHTCVTLFFRRHVDPLPWHDDETKESAWLLKSDLRAVVGNPSLVRAFRQVVTQGNKERNDSCGTPREQHVAVARVVTFWRRMELWLRAAVVPLNEGDEQESWSLLHALAYVGGCPAQVAQLAVMMNSNHAQTYDAHGNLPLHILCAGAPSHTDDCHSFLRALLTAYPQASQCVNARGRLPLNIALATGKCGNYVRVLIASEPRVLTTRDVETGLPSFALAAASPMLNTHLHAYGTSNVGSLWHFLPPLAQQERLAQALRDLETVQLNTIYDILRSMPSAVQH